MFFDTHANRLSNIIKVSKLTTTSGASRKKNKLDFSVMNKLKNAKFGLIAKNNSGKSRTGRYTVFSKGRALKRLKLLRVNYSFRDSSIILPVGINTNLRNKKMSLSTLTASGKTSQLPLNDSSSLFLLSYFNGLTHKKSLIYKSLISLMPNISLSSAYGLLAYVNQGSSVSFLELHPSKGIQYVRSSGSKGILLKQDSLSGSSIVKLPSKVKKVFSSYSLSCPGRVSFSEKKLLNTTSSVKGTVKLLKPRSRGVAKNPVDHPHGGRAKAIKYQRTPWGKTTKFK